MTPDPSRPRSEISQLVIELRTALGETQQQFAVRLGVALTSVARWETTYPPRAERIEQLAVLAEENGHPDIAKRFRKAFRHISPLGIVQLAEEAMKILEDVIDERLAALKTNEIGLSCGFLAMRISEIRDIAIRLD